MIDLLDVVPSELKLGDLLISYKFRGAANFSYLRAWVLACDEVNFQDIHVRITRVHCLTRSNDFQIDMYDSSSCFIYRVREQ